MPFKAHYLRRSRLIIYAVQGSLYTLFKAHDFCRSGSSFTPFKAPYLRHITDPRFIRFRVTLGKTPIHTYIFEALHLAVRFWVNLRTRSKPCHLSLVIHGPHAHTDTMDLHRINIFPYKTLSRANFSWQFTFKLTTTSERY